MEKINGMQMCNLEDSADQHADQQTQLDWSRLLGFKHLQDNAAFKQSKDLKLTGFAKVGVKA